MRHVLLYEEEMKPEAKIKQKIKAYLNKLPKSYWFHYSAYMGESGIPDRLGVLNGMFVGVEVKAPGKKPTAIQEAKHKDLRRAGAIIIVAHSVEELEEELKEEGLLYD